MASIISGYEYDIFISYRQKDNKHDGWVNKFVENLKGELDSTFKEDISIYFDENPHDRLQETHDVGLSLEGKLKCLIFVPILSQTYCDPNSYAWQYEFLAFNKFAGQDQFGKNIRLRNGNYATRILPVRIHDLDQEDIRLFEKETGSVLRAMDFVFRTAAGVNRPLQQNEDRPNDNLNKTIYRDQLNKVAISIKEIITALKNPVLQSGESTATLKPFNAAVQTERSLKKNTRIKYPIIAVVALLLLITAYFLYHRLSSSVSATREIDKSIAILPFVDISEAHDQTYFTDGMMVEILDHLFKMKELRIIPLNTTAKYKDSAEPLTNIAHQLGVAHLIQGSVRRVGNIVKISVALIEGKTEKYLWQHTYQDDITDLSRIFIVQSDVAAQIANALSVRITPEINSRMNTFPTQSREAYDLYLKAEDKWGEESIENLNNIAYLNKAVAIDSNFADAYVALGKNYWILAHFGKRRPEEYWRKSKEYLKKAIALDPQNSRAYSELAVVQGSWDWDARAGLKSLQMALTLNPADIKNYTDLFYYYVKRHDCDSMNATLQTMKQLQPGEYYINELVIKICEGDENGLRRMNPPDDFIKDGGPEVQFEVWRLIIIKDYEKALKIMATTDQFDEAVILEEQAITFSLLGKEPETKSDIARLEKLATERYVPPSILGTVYLARGDEKHAYEYFEQGISEHDLWMQLLPYNALFFGKRSDPKFRDLMKRTWIN
jgi:adenylate cyclase